MRSFFWVIFISALLHMPAKAARPFVTDDARLTTAGSCQLESWTRFYADSTEVWALPACNPTGNLELTLGGGQARYQDTSLSTSEDYVLQAKTLFRPLDTDGWGWGAAVGTVRHPEINPGPNLHGNTYIYFPLSMSFADDRVVVHLNAGWLHDKSLSRERLTWGIGSEINATQRLTLVAESFGDVWRGLTGKPAYATPSFRIYSRWMPRWGDKPVPVTRIAGFLSACVLRQRVSSDVQVNLSQLVSVLR